ncbi:pali-domain-containing protein [Thelephora ganbajun]|uniref:Pali-domain-containing protein n=1 Tax=Thelephora ganbajun TaxID=370292 RepID=A0ACB6Z2A1_THEGA|nr:pali-domain-containing protein [Thelephora ganbajun]
MAASAAFPGLFFCLAACVLLIFVSVSPPTWDSVYFLSTGVGAGRIRFGVFGYTGSTASVGYNFPARFRGYKSVYFLRFLPPLKCKNSSPVLIRRISSDGRLSSSIIHNLTYTLILHPIAAGLSGLAVLFGICGAAYHRSGTVFMSLVSGLAFLCTLIAWVIDMALWGITRKVLRDNGVSAQYGNANWLTLGALVALFIGFFTGACGIFGSYRKRRYHNAY